MTREPPPTPSSVKDPQPWGAGRSEKREQASAGEGYVPVLTNSRIRALTRSGKSSHAATT
jgi:hypothetical protein